ncbi:hypothetical protein ABU178_01605 [Pantoea osteomyelitidis]|uniref:Uncharacterized protein n=1 Tax=Pantoea osteomyelitidis TaxID=3230026 RepID=A0ABW7PRH4_9GAMM
MFTPGCTKWYNRAALRAEGANFPGFFSRIESITDIVRTNVFWNKAVAEVFPAQAWRHFYDRTLTEVPVMGALFVQESFYG